MGAKRSRRDAEEVPADGLTPDRGTPLVRSEEEHGGKQRKQRSNLIALHRARFVEWEPTAAVASGASGDGTVLAVARESGDVELWNADHWSCITRLAGSRDLAITSIAWTREERTGAWRLFTAGLDGWLTEWDIQGRRPKQRTDSMGGAVWDMAMQPPDEAGPSSIVAVACDDGCLRLFRAEEGQPGLVYAASLPSLGSRLLSVAWNPKGNVVLTGTSEGSLHAWNVNSRREILRIHTGDETKTRQDVWALAVLPDGTMVTGDGGGHVQFWDAAHGALITSLKAHTADVLAVAAAPDGTRVFASGADCQIAVFQKLTQPGRPARWEYLESKRPHTHDVRTLCVVSPAHPKVPVLVSGGHDAQLFAYRIPQFTKEHPFRLTMTPDAPQLRFATRDMDGRPPLLLSVQRENADLWELPSSSAQGESGWMAHKAEGQQVRVSAMPVHIARLSTAGSGQIAAAAVSPDGSLVAIADSEEVHMYAVAEAEEGPAPGPKRRPFSWKPEGPVAHLAFTSHNLLIVRPAGQIVVVGIEDSKQVAVLEPSPVAGGKSSPSASFQIMQMIKLISVSPNGKYAALLRPQEVHLFDLEGLNYHGMIPAREGSGPSTVLEFGPLGDVLAIGTANNSLFLYNVASRQLVDLSDQLATVLQDKLGKMPGSISCIAFTPDSKKKLALVATPSSMCIVDFVAPATPASPRNKRLRRHTDGSRVEEKPDPAGTNTRVINLKHVCLGCHFTSERGAVLVEKDWAQLLASFPAPLYRHRYGT